jgi:DNA-directed RNA polymerase specialized sigma24 family protein
MALITIPFDYGNLDDPNSIVPICINDTDVLGRQISWRWIVAIVPIADRLRGLARYRLGDEWRASELTDSTLHEVWCKHLNDFGMSPSGRIWRNAKWKAEDLRAGGWRARRGI